MGGSNTTPESNEPVSKTLKARDPNEQKIIDEIAGLESFQKKLEKSCDAAEEQFKKMLEECNQEILKRIQFINDVKEAWKAETDEEKKAELQDILNNSEKLLKELEGEVKSKIVNARTEVNSAFLTHDESLRAGTAEGARLCQRFQESGSPIDVKSEKGDSVNQYCKNMQQLRNSISTFVTSIPGKIDALSSFFNKNKTQHHSIEKRFETYKSMKKEQNKELDSSAKKSV
ncbi:MAG TPA: hypothetical protein VLI69_03605 [Gammaproteobacteria bacterium]|nr:hypothetical protein [Gammaproteobacteria bacterium]